MMDNDHLAVFIFKESFALLPRMSMCAHLGVVKLSLSPSNLANISHFATKAENVHNHTVSISMLLLLLFLYLMKLSRLL